MPARPQDRISRNASPETPADNAPQALAPDTKLKFRTGESVVADRVFRGLAIPCAVGVFVIEGLILFELVLQSRLSVHKFGLHFLTKTIWDPVIEDFGALPFIYGTLV